MSLSTPSFNAGAEGPAGAPTSAEAADVGRYHPRLGRAAPRLGWVPAPRYLLRRDLVLRTMRALPTGRVLEIGCGAGALIEDLCRFGFQCDALETSEQALRVAREILKPWNSACVHGRPAEDWIGRFDVVLSFEVLEHIKEDRTALAQWASWLRRDGLMVLSVPAHMSRWAPDDEWAGHFRRYERSDLVQLFEEVGLEVIQFENYGFPLGNIAGFFRRSVHAAGMKESPAEISERTARSGVERSTELRLWPLLSSFPGVTAMRFGMALQRLFLASERGDGYLVVGRRI